MLDLIAKYHKHWVKVVKGYGEYTYAEDIVQEMYLRVSRYADKSKLITDGELNGGYIRFVLMTMAYDFHKQKKRASKVCLEDTYELVQEVNEEDKGYGKFLDRLDKELATWEEFERNMFKLYIGTYRTQNIKTHGLKISIRKFSAESGISIMTIFKTLKRCKKRIKQNLSEDWEDYINKDYERI